MLSICLMKGSGRADYYLDLAREDYYLAGGEPPGHWLGNGAIALRLTEEVKREDLRALMLGFSPGRRRPLVQNAGDRHRQSGWDLTYSAPKSVSVFWVLSSSEVRRQIQKAQHQAVARAIA